MPNDDFLSLEEIKNLLADKRLYVIARKTGLSYPTIKKLADGKVENYTYKTLLLVNKYLKPEVDDSTNKKKD